MPKGVKKAVKKLKGNSKDHLLDLNKHIVKIPSDWLDWYDAGPHRDIIDNVADITRLFSSIWFNPKTVQEFEYNRRYSLYKRGVLVPIDEEHKEQILKLEKRLEKKLLKGINASDDELSSENSDSDS